MILSCNRHLGKRYYFESDGKLASSKWITKKVLIIMRNQMKLLASGWLTVDGKILYESFYM